MGAHEETALHALSVIDRVSPQIRGVSFRVVQLTQPVLVARNTTDQALIVTGTEGEPFLRLFNGRIESNARSELTYVSRDPTGSHAAAPEDLEPNKEPIWRPVERGKTWSWFDPRIRFATTKGRPWEISARLGSREILIRGSFESFDGHGHFTTELLPIDPPIDRLEIKLMDGLVPALFVRNETKETLAVEGRHSEPFLTIGPRGVFANLRSPDYYLGGNQTVRPVPPSADPTAPPRWRKLSEVPIWSWLEFRARLPASTHERSRLGTEEHAVLEWTSPMTLGRRPVEVIGRVLWIPPVSHTAAREPNRVPWIAGLAALLIAGGAFLYSRRPRTRPLA